MVEINYNNDITFYFFFFFFFFYIHIERIDIGTERYLTLIFNS